MKRGLFVAVLMTAIMYPVFSQDIPTQEDIDAIVNSLQKIRERLPPAPDPPPPPPPVEKIPLSIIIDNRSTRFGFHGPWITFPTGYAGNMAYAAKGDGSAVATWEFKDAPPSEYRVLATWIPHPNRAKDAPFSVYDDSMLVDTVRVNQEEAPVTVIDGVAWQEIGTFPHGGGVFSVRLSNDADDHVIADAVRLEYETEPDFKAYPATDPPKPFDKSRIYYIGSCRGPSFMNYGGHATAFDEAREDARRLLVAGFDKEPNNSIAYVLLPTHLGRGGDPGELPMAALDGAPLDPLTPAQRPGDHFTIRGLLKPDETIYGAGIIQYDNAPFNRGSHWKLLPGQVKAEGLFELTTEGDDFPAQGVPLAGYVAGAMADVPPEWQQRLGGDTLSGSGYASIVTRLSTGPSASAFWRDDLGTVRPPAKVLFSYPARSGSWPSNPGETQYTPNTAASPREWLRGNTGTAIAFLPETILVAGSEGVGAVYYGGGDPDNQPPPGTVFKCLAHSVDGFRNRILFYDPRDAEARLRGEKKPWEVRPFDHLTLDHHALLREACLTIGSGSYHDAARRLALVQPGAYYNGSDKSGCVIHLFGIR